MSYDCRAAAPSPISTLNTRTIDCHFMPIGLGQGEGCIGPVVRIDMIEKVPMTFGRRDGDVGNDNTAWFEARLEKLDYRQDHWRPDHSPTSQMLQHSDVGNSLSSNIKSTGGTSLSGSRTSPPPSSIHGSTVGPANRAILSSPRSFHWLMLASNHPAPLPAASPHRWRSDPHGSG